MRKLIIVKWYLAAHELKITNFSKFKISDSRLTDKIFGSIRYYLDVYSKPSQKSRIDPVDTGRKLNVHKMFRRRPGRLLNVLCTFSLRPVSTGERFAKIDQG